MCDPGSTVLKEGLTWPKVQGGKDGGRVLSGDQAGLLLPKNHCGAATPRAAPRDDTQGARWRGMSRAAHAWRRRTRRGRSLPGERRALKLPGGGLRQGSDARSLRSR
jgi:hypothetical protein